MARRKLCLWRAVCLFFDPFRPRLSLVLAPCCNGAISIFSLVFLVELLYIVKISLSL